VIEYPKLFIGPMTKNVVDAIIKFCDAEKENIGLIPSRRQVECDGGYVNNWTTQRFADYVKQRSTLILQRDHGGIGQGDCSARASFTSDASSGFDLIHIDPWKVFTNVESAAAETVANMRFINSINPNCRFEVGTEEAIRKYEVDELEQFLEILAHKDPALFDKIIFVVIQSGTGIQGTQNIGTFDEQRCADMIALCNRYNVLSKEHNGDYLTSEQLVKRFNLGLSAINIAPEFGVLETKCILDAIETKEQFDTFFDLCYQSNRWQKWLPEDFELTNKNKRDIVMVSGHYVFACNQFIELKQQLQGIDTRIRNIIYHRLKELSCAIKSSLLI
tara:strand:+ start:1381 stop:2376 length:996 start_codon:yes stop_codon:yes gene_type:complete